MIQATLLRRGADRWIGAVLAGLAANCNVADAAEPVPWTIDGRCVARVCVGDTLHSLRHAIDPSLTVRNTAAGVEVLGAGARWLRVELEDGADAASPASRIALIEVLRPGTRTGLAHTRLGGPADALRSAAAGGRWLPLQEAFAGRPVRWWSVPRASPPGIKAYPVNFAVDRQGRLAGAVLNGANEREAAYPDLATALTASQARLRALQPALAVLPQRAPALQAKTAVFADLTLLAQSASLRLTSRADCGGTSCEIMLIDVGTVSTATDGGATESMRLADGSAARFRPTTCGGSCSPALLLFERAALPVRISFETGFTTPPGTRLDAVRDRRLLLELAGSSAAR